MRKARVAVLAVVLTMGLLLLAGNAWAAVIEIPIDNHSFETNSGYGDYGYGWVCPPGWIPVNDVDNIGYFHKIYLSAGYVGDYAMMADAGMGEGLSVYAYQDTGVTFQTGYIYTLTVAIGTQINLGDGVATQISLREATGDTSLASLDYSTATDLIDKTLEYTAVAADDGKEIRVRLQATYPADPGDAAAFDNVRLTYTPEPATLALMGLGGVGLLVRRKRR